MHASLTWGGTAATACGAAHKSCACGSLFRVPLASKSGAAVGISAAEGAILVYSRLQGQQFDPAGTFSWIWQLAAQRH